MMVQDDNKIDEDVSCKPAVLSPQKSSENTVASFEFGNILKQKPTLLLHSCCGPCSTAVIESLVQTYKITIYFSNSNIDDEAEYEKRLQTQKNFITSYNASQNCVDPVSLIVGPYKPLSFLKLVEGREDEAEGGERCRICMMSRLEQTADFASINGYQYFTTTLSVSPHKNYEVIARIGKELMFRYGVQFIDENFKKRGGHQRSIELSKFYDLYRQNYCGCSFSKKEMIQRSER